MGFRLRLDRAGWSCYDRTMRAFICEVDMTGLRQFFSEDVLAGDGVRGYIRHRSARPTTVAWTLLEDGDAESIRSEVAAGHHEAACRAAPESGHRAAVPRRGPARDDTAGVTAPLPLQVGCRPVTKTAGDTV